jgi:hypothetical protein
MLFYWVHKKHRVRVLTRMAAGDRVAFDRTGSTWSMSDA